MPRVATRDVRTPAAGPCARSPRSSVTSDCVCPPAHLLSFPLPSSSLPSSSPPRLRPLHTPVPPEEKGRRKEGGRKRRARQAQRAHTHTDTHTHTHTHTHTLTHRQPTRRPAIMAFNRRDRRDRMHRAAWPTSPRKNQGTPAPAQCERREEERRRGAWVGPGPPPGQGAGRWEPSSRPREPRREETRGGSREEGGGCKEEGSGCKEEGSGCKTAETTRGRSGKERERERERKREREREREHCKTGKRGLHWNRRGLLSATFRV